MTSETLWSTYIKKHPNPTAAMTELSFAKSFLSTLDSRPLKLQSDYAIDPKKLEITAPYTLPRMPTPYKKGSQNPDPNADPAGASVTVTLKSSRNPVLSLSLPGTSVGTSVLELKEKVARELRIQGTEKIRVLFNKKPAGDVKTVKELVGDEVVAGKEVEFGIMVMGYREEASTTEDASMKDSEAPVAQGTSGEEVLAGDEFWNDLRGFLMQRIRDEGKAEEVFDAFKGGWKSKSGG